jgi:alkanesulfonate monooxygenase SsuD/methylene tetrahydromethanopterin reductase-like flavin-dependent oxidoreductase (luciferase family)
MTVSVWYAGAVRYAVSCPNVGDPGELVALARVAEAAGWDAFTLWDHLHLSRAARLDVHDPFVVLGGAAVVTQRILLGTLVTPVARRRPWKLAKELVTLDHLSGGRLLVGVGLGVPVDDEFAAFAEVTDDRTRAERLDEGLAVVDAVLQGRPVRHEGAHFRVDADLLPGGVQRPRAPIWVAAFAPNRRPLRRAARYEGVVPLSGAGAPVGPDEIATFLRSEPELVEAMARPGYDVVMGRAPGIPADAYADAGATWLVESAWPEGDWFDDLARRVRQGPAA